MKLHPDFRDLLSAFANSGVEYLIIGGYAVGYHARPRFTKDIDLWVADTPENLERVARALETFGAPDTVVQAFRASTSDDILWMGAPPTRIDILRRVPGVGAFEGAFLRRVIASWDSIPVNVISRDDLIAAKRAADRDQDRLDVAALLKSART